MKSKKQQFVTSIWFIIALAILFINDWILKDTFANSITGKLSDFAGVFLLPIFLYFIFKKGKNTLLMISGLFFIYWKSPLSQGLIDAVNSILPFHYSRVVDYSDLWALIMLIPAYFILQNKWKVNSIKISPVIPFFICAFAFMATSIDDYIYLDQKYTFNQSKSEVALSIYQNNSIIQSYGTVVTIDTVTLTDTVLLNIFLTDESLCDDINIRTELYVVNANQSAMYFNGTSLYCNEKCGLIRRCDNTNTAEEIIEVLESNFINHF